MAKAEKGTCRHHPLLRRHHLVWERRLDLSLMNEASAHVLGRHDFASFCRRREGATTIRTLLEFGWERDASGVVEATVRADAFCHSMVRALVGCVLAVGDGRAAVSWPAEVLAEAARNGAVVVAEARGLTLEEVAYPADDELRARAELTRAKRVADVAESEAGNTGAGDSDG